MGIIKRYYGIKFPFTIQNNDNIFIDLNDDFHEKVASEIAHVILTPKQSRLRMPEFGTNLIRYIFSPNDDLTWVDIETDIRENVSKYVPNALIHKVQVHRSENGDNSIFLNIDFGVKKGTIIENNSMLIKI